MVQENHIDKALAFMESLEKLGNQLKAAEEHQKAGSQERESDRRRGICWTLAEEQKSAGHHRQMAPYLSGAHGDGKERKHSEKKKK